MWRAYGGDCSVALVMNNTPFFADTDIFHAYSYPVSYQNAEDFSIVLSKLTARIKNESKFIKGLGKQLTISYLFDFFKTTTSCVKHPGFKEELEWRIAYNPKVKKSDYITSSTETINGIPQEIHKIPLKDIPEGNFYGATIPDLINKIIIGPNDHQQILGQTFEKLLEEAGCKNPNAKIHYSGIPLR